MNSLNVLYEERILHIPQTISVLCEAEFNKSFKHFTVQAVTPMQIDRLQGVILPAYAI